MHHPSHTNTDDALNGGPSTSSMASHHSHTNTNDALNGGPSTSSMASHHSKRSTRSSRKKKKKPSGHTDLNLGPKRGWTEQANLEMTRKFHEEMLKKAHSYIGKELDEHENRLKTAAKLFDQSTARENAQRFQQARTSSENKRLLKRLLKVEMQETEITKTNAPGCAEKVRFRRQKKARKKALRASKQHKLDKINRENGMMLARLQNAQGSLNSKTWSKDYARHKKQGRLMSKMRHVRYKKKKNRRPPQSPMTSVHNSQSLPSFGSPNEQERQRRGRLIEEGQTNYNDQQYHQQQQQQQQRHPQQSHSSSTSSLPPLSPETSLRTMNERVAMERERQRLLGVFSSLSIKDLSQRLERYAELLSPQLSMEGFRSMVKDLPKAVLVRTLADVVRQAPQYAAEQGQHM